MFTTHHILSKLSSVSAAKSLAEITAWYPQCFRKQHADCLYL